ncbi:MAG: hypothetical protein II744_08485, partial [Eubacterium sp.]|nr:hypothetical protein [Eubacterium sp.]
VCIEGGTLSEREALKRELTSVQAKAAGDFCYKSNRYVFVNGKADCTVYIVNAASLLYFKALNKNAVVYITCSENKTVRSLPTDINGVPVVKATPSSAQGINSLLEAVNSVCKGCPVRITSRRKFRFILPLFFAFSFLFTAALYFLLCCLIMLVC